MEQPDNPNASKASQKEIIPKPTFSRSTSLHTYTCAGVDGCVKGRKFASESTRLLLSSIRFFLNKTFASEFSFKRILKKRSTCCFCLRLFAVF